MAAVREGVVRPNFKLVLAALAALALAGSCSTPPPARSCTSDQGCDPGERCLEGACVAGDAGGGPVDPPADAGSDAGTEFRPDATAVIYDPNNPRKDTDCDGLSDAEEYANVYAAGRKTSPNDRDSDDDGILDGVEAGRTSSIDPQCAGFFAGDADPETRTDPTSTDSDGDGIADGLEDDNHDGRVQAGESDASRGDSDGDGLADGVEDANQSGAVDPGETDPFNPDSDGDGLPDKLEKETGTDPADADTDGDGYDDGLEDRNRNGSVEAGAGETNPRDANSHPSPDTVVLPGDADRDGITDAIERDVTHTDPALADSDGDGLDDGEEDLDRDGVVDAGESNPLSKDSDCDGLKDSDERGYGTDPLVADFDLDGILDGVEVGATSSPQGTCTGFLGDAAPLTKTNPARVDTDCDGRKDGEEDANKNGRVDPGETDPNRADTDGDGLPDGLEKGVGTNPDPSHCASVKLDAHPTSTTDPLVADSDGDGLRDGLEDANASGSVDGTEPDPNSKDTDCDGLGDAEERVVTGSNPNVLDTDGDLIPDGVEAGKAASPEPLCLAYVGDQDPTTRTSATAADTDGDGLSDGQEDRNRNGKREPTETDPFISDTDGDGLPDGKEDADKDGIVDLGETSALLADSDGDAIPDGIEDVNRDGIRQAATETDPRKADTDNDTCKDGEEDRNWNHTVEANETDPLAAGDCPPPSVADTDCDGLSDAVETSAAVATNPAVRDTDGDGLSDGIERGVTVSPNPAACSALFVADLDPSTTTNAKRIDSDCDGLTDGEEDPTNRGRLDPGETNPANPDSDGDGLSDGLEFGVTAPADPTLCPNTPVDVDAATSTDPLDPDSDGDGVADGAEDVNHNGRVDFGELDPGNSADATGPVQQACATPRVINSFEYYDSDLHVAATDAFTETSILTAAGKRVGVMLYDPTRKIAAFALHDVSPSATAGAQETEGRNHLSSLGTVSSAITQGFTSWDGYDAVQGYYKQDDAADLKARARQMVLKYVGADAASMLQGNAGVTGPFRVQAEYLRRAKPITGSSPRSIIVMAFIPETLYATGDNLFRLDDLANGTALAQFGDVHDPICDKLTSSDFPLVDFIWVVDNSGSMGNQQAAVASAVDAMAAQLEVAPINWRVAVLYSDTDRGAPGSPVAFRPYRPFTRDPAQFKTWATPGVDGGSPERGFAPINYALRTGELLPALAPKPASQETATERAKLRIGAKVVIVWLTDAREQNSNTSSPTYTVLPAGYANWTEYFEDLPGGMGKSFVAGILCPVGVRCPGEETQTSEYRDVITALQGVESDIRNTAEIPTAIEQIIKSAVGFATPTKLSLPPISASLKVAIAGPVVPARTGGAGCTLADVRRSRTDGFDYDGASKTLVFYGDCRPAAGNQTIAASYRFWTDRTPNPDVPPSPCGTCPAGKVCDPVSVTCVCPSDCQSNCQESGKTCDPDTCGCVCAPDCGGLCDGNQECNTGSCTCQCRQNVTCAPGYTYDASASVCGCVCDTSRNCGPGKSVNPATCQCECADCGGSCTGNQRCDTGSCTCTCNPATTCSAGKVLDLASCSCVCPIQASSCPADTHLDTATCGCVCNSAPATPCPAGQRWDVGACACVCDSASSCPAGFVRDSSSCACVCDVDALSCAAPRVKDAATCSCVCNPDCSHPTALPGGCAPGLSCDTTSCGCECNLTSCPAGFKVDAASCSCVCDTEALGCDARHVADPSICACVCKSEPACGGCPVGQNCNLSACACTGGVN